jgi:hypothetical protein
LFSIILKKTTVASFWVPVQSKGHLGFWFCDSPVEYKTKGCFGRQVLKTALRFIFDRPFYSASADILR